MIEPVKALAIEQVKALAIFATVIDAGGSKAAASELQLKPSVVNDHILKLESDLGLELLSSSARKLTLTLDGQALYLVVKKMMNVVLDGLQGMSNNHVELVGSLKISMPSTFTGSHFLTKIAKFKQDHEQVEIDIHFSDLHQNIIGEGVDLAIRISTFPNGRLMVKKIDELQPIVMASPAYIQRRGVDLAELKHPNDIADWDFIGIAQRPMRKIFMDENGEDLRLEFKPCIVVDNVEAAQYLACQGLGVVSPPAFLYGDKLKTGELVALLPNCKMKRVPVNAVWPPNSEKNHLIQRLVDALVK